MAVAPRVPLEEVKKQIQLKGPSALKAGVAKVEITPPVGTPLAGYSKRKGRPSVGIRDPLYVRVLAVSDGEDVAVFVSSDLLIFPYPMAQRILQRVTEELKTPRQAITLAATHTHSGTGSIAHGFLYERVFGKYRPEIEEGIAGRLTWAIRQAVTQQQPVSWASSERATGVLEDFLENRENPLGIVDPSLRVLLVESQERRPLAILVNASAHPTLLDSQDLRFSADYPGELTRILETKYPSAVCLFFNGTAGNVRPRDSIGSNAEERVVRFGKLLAEAATGMISRMEPQPKGDLACWGMWVALPPPQVYIGRIPIHPVLGRFMRPEVAYLHLVALEETVFVPLSAEMTAELGGELKEVFSLAGFRPFPIGYSDGYLGYAVTSRQYRLRTYEAWMSWYGRDFGSFLIGKIRQLVVLYFEKKAKP